MILDRDKGKEDHRKIAMVLNLSNDLCNKFTKLDLRNSATSENNDNFSKGKEKVKMNNFEDDAVNKIGDQFSNIKLDEKGESANSDKLKYIHQDRASAKAINIINFEEEKVQSDDENDDEKSVIQAAPKEWSPEEGVDAKADPESLKNKEKLKLVKEEVLKVQASDPQSEIPDEPKKKEISNEVLCSRGPVAQKLFQPQYQPYFSRTCSQSLNCGGKVRVAESVGQTVLTHNCLPVNDFPNFNITPNVYEQCRPTVQTSYLPVAEGQHNVDLIDDETNNIITYLAAHNNLIGNCCDILMNECNGSPGNVQTILRECPPPKPREDLNQNTFWKDEGTPSSPDSFQSNTGSPENSYQPLFPRACSNNSDSGRGTPESGLEDAKECLQELVGTEAANVRTEMWVHTTQEMQGIPEKISEKAPEKVPETKYRLILPKPEMSTGKTKFQDILNGDRRLRAWAKIQTLSPEDFVTGDEEDGDTQLMILVSNQYEGHLELIYAMVERMRNIPQSLAIRNKSGQSALYLACKMLPEQPLVAPYIAEALLEQKIDVANETYENDLTLPEILQKEGDSHRAVLRELLELKDNSGKFVFETFRRNDVNGNK